jgi:ribosomal protein S18 acetylase RimI-like enzyme
VPGATVSRIGDFQVSDSSLDHDTYNIVSRLGFERGFATDDVAEIARRVRESGRPFSWWVADEAALPEATAALAEVGFEPRETEEVMAADLGVAPFRTAAPDGVELRTVRTADELDDYARILAANWDPPAEEVARFLHAAGTSAGWSEDGGFVVAYTEGRPVAGAELHLAAGVAGIYGVATLAAHRGRGIASALLSLCLDRAAAAGARVAVLQATADGSGVYRRHGFRAIGGCTEFGPAA